MRYILKKVLGLMPLYGFMVHRHGGIFVRQGGLKDAEEIRRKLKHMADLKQPVSGRAAVVWWVGHVMDSLLLVFQWFLPRV